MHQFSPLYISAGFSHCLLLSLASFISSFMVWANICNSLRLIALDSLVWFNYSTTVGVP